MQLCAMPWLQRLHTTMLPCREACVTNRIIMRVLQGKSYSKGDELGYFAFGGSTVIAVFAKDKIAIDQDILHNRCGAWRIAILEAPYRDPAWLVSRF